jgi:pimeloyl-ACP methyl ester carboxylesterase
MDKQNKLSTKEVKWLVDEIEVEATLTLPEGTGPFPAVIMVAGSGPTDRNWTSPLLPGTNGSAALLAGELTQRGFATLRYDKRASGPHIKENMEKLMGKVSMQGHMEELAGGVAYLANQPNIDAKQIFALTNSEGCIHALNYQIKIHQPPFKGMVLTGAPARSVGDVAHSQVAEQMKALPQGSQWLAEYEHAINDFAQGKPIQIDPDLPQALQMTLGALSSPMNQPFARELWVTNPSELLKQVKTPVLVLIGKKDIQVDWQADGSIFEKEAASRDNISVEFPENANHVLKYEPLERSKINPAEATQTYNIDSTHLDPQCVGIIADWLNEHLSS